MKLNQKRRAKKILPRRENNPLFVPEFANQVWSADFVSDSLYSSKRFRTFNIIDDCNREVVHIEIDTSLTSRRLISVFEKLRLERGLPEVLRCDNGPEFLGAEFVSWSEDAGMTIMYIQPGKPNQNAYIERFNRTYRTEVLDLYLFDSLEDVRELTYWWLIDNNEKCPHDALDDMAYDEKTENSCLELSTIRGSLRIFSLNLAPVTYVSTETMTALSMHILKTIVYQTGFKMFGNVVLQGCFIGFSMMLGAWFSKKIIRII